MRNAFLLVLSVLLGLGLPACGSGGGDDADFLGLSPGPFAFGLPVGFGGSVDILSLTNKSGLHAPVFVHGYTAAGASYGPGSDLVIPPFGTIELPLSSALGGPGTAGGFVYVDSRDVDVLDASGLPTPVATSGFVYPTIERRIGGVNPTADVYEGFVFRSTPVSTTVHSETTAVQVYNASVDFAAGGAVPKPISVGIKEYDLDGTLVTDTTATIFDKATFAFTPTVAHGMVMVTPVSGADLFQLGIRGVERAFYTSIEQRYKRDSDFHLPELREVGFEVDFGSDIAGNTYDFGMLLSNPSDEDKTVVLQAIYRGGGAEPMLAAPRFFTVTAHTTVFMATSNALSFGLKIGESSFFDDLFGNVFAFAGFEAVTLSVQVPREVNVSVRRFDPAFDSFYVVQHGILRTNAAAALHLPIEPFLGTGNYNEVILTNIIDRPIDVPIRMTTPGGTEYILDTITVPARSRLIWSPDGLQRREDPTDTVGPLVTRACFRFSPTAGLYFRARRRELNTVGAIILISPQIVRDLLYTTF